MEPAAWIARFDGEVKGMLGVGGIPGGPWGGAGRMLVTQALA